jgi:uncharacterized C2H2 Zn-finger protein
MAKTLLDSLKQIVSAKASLRDKTKRLAEVERRVVEEVRRLLSSIGYVLAATDGQGATTARPSPKSRARKTLPKTLKCPKCDRRFSLRMHVVRHMNAMHQATKSAAKRTRRKTTKKGK